MTDTGHPAVKYINRSAHPELMEKEHGLSVFQGKNIRRVWRENEWWFSVFDIVAALTESADPKQYVKKMRSRDPALDAKWGTICTPLEILAPDGKRRETNCVNAEGAFRIIQSIPSPKAEPFKLWLAKVGYERVQEIENPELAQERMKELYERKGYSKSWIDKRVRGIAVRQDLTDEWKQRGVERHEDFSILTAEIAKATFGMTPSEYKKLKRLTSENLRDHMNDLELIFTMLGEASTAEIERADDPSTLVEHKRVSRDGGAIAKSARVKLERRTKRRVVSDENYLDEPEREKRKRLPKGGHPQ